MIDDIPSFTAMALTVCGFLLAVSCIFSRLSNRLGLPVSLLFLGIGLAVGPEGPGKLLFDRFDIAYVFGTLALVTILFSGGLNTPFHLVKKGVGPAAVLATLGVMGVAGLTAVGGRLLGLGWGEALLIGAIVSSTDAAAVFSVLHGVHLRGRVGPTIEVESGMNDPVAVILTSAMTAHLIGATPIGWSLLPQMGAQLLIGAGFGAFIGFAGRAILQCVRLSTSALYPVLTLGFAFSAFGGSTWLGGSGFLAVYIAAILIGNAEIPHRHTLTRVHDSLAWLAQVSMFLMLGLLVKPSQLPGVAATGFMLALFLALIARPVVVTLCLLPFRFNWREILCISWVGLRGAVPIILATVPVLSLAGQSPEMREVLNAFEIVFFVGLVGAILPGATVRWATRKLDLQKESPPPPTAEVEISSGEPLRASKLNFFIGPKSPVASKTLSELALPSDASVMLVVRQNELITPRGHTRLEVGDHAFVFCKESEQIVRERFR